MFFFSFKQCQNKRKSYGIKVRWHLKLDSYITVFLTTCNATCWIMCKVWWWSKMELKYLPESIIAFATRKWTVQQLHFIIDVHKNSLNWFTINLIMMLKSESGDNISNSRFSGVWWPRSSTEHYCSEVDISSIWHHQSRKAI